MKFPFGRSPKEKDAKIIFKTLNSANIFRYLSEPNCNQFEFNNLFGKRISRKLGIYDIVITILLLILSATIRFYNISHPSGCCFDETFFGNFTNYYVNKTYFIDIHPPLGKLLIYFGGKIGGYKGKCTFKTGEYYEKDCGYEILRKVVAMYSSLCAPIIYISLRIFDLQIFPSICGALLTAFEDMLIIEGKLILTDGILHCFVCIAILSIAKLFSLSPMSKQYDQYYIIMCIFVSIACSIKQTAWSLIPISLLLVTIQLFCDRIVRTKGKIRLQFLITIAIKSLILFAIFAFSCIFITIVHIWIIPNYNQEFSGFVCRNCVTNYKDKLNEWNKYQNTFVIKRAINLLRYMNKNNMGQCDNLGLPSRWWQWPLMKQALISYFIKDGYHLQIHINIFNSYIVVLFVVISVFQLYYAYFSGNSSIILMKQSLSTVIFFFGYILSLVPFFLIPRATYIYHYSISIIFGFMLISSLLNNLYNCYKKLTILLCILISSGAIVSYYIYFPLTYGLTISDEKFDKLMLNPKWTKPVFE